jgi:hypothetical protein
MKKQYRVINYHTKNLDLLEKTNQILKEYSEQDIRVTLRQVYYQLVARDIIPNLDKEYKKLSNLLTNARYSGHIDWLAIEDRTRVPEIPTTYSSIKELLDVASQSYQLDRWNDQDFYIELWTEKDAISSVISPITNSFQVPLVVNRGYSSASSMYSSAVRYLLNSRLENYTFKKMVLLYLGDFDPSGLDMDRDIRERLREFDVDLEVIRIGLTKRQILKYKPPINPAKLKDTRAKEYISKHGYSSWEVDALKPDILQKLISNSILEYLDLEKFELVKEKEIEDLKDLKRV